MMIFQFNDLTECQQAGVIKKYGVLIQDRIEGEARVFLYQLDSFYIELFHDINETTTKPLRILRTFKDSKQLDCYVLNIDTSALLADIF